MKNKYESAEIKIVYFSNAAVIVASANSDVTEFNPSYSAEDDETGIL